MDNTMHEGNNYLFIMISEHGRTELIYSSTYCKNPLLKHNLNTQNNPSKTIEIQKIQVELDLPRP